MRTLIVTVAAAALLAACGQSAPKQETAATAPAAVPAPDANAQGPGGPGGFQLQPQTLDEMIQRANARFDRADTNADGKLTQAEIAAAVPQRNGPPGGGQGGPGGPAAGGPRPDGQAGPGGGGRRGGFGGGFARADANDDGIVTKAEVEAQTTERFNRQDTDGDGVVTPEELRAGFGGRRGQGGGPGGAGEGGGPAG